MLYIIFLFPYTQNIVTNIVTFCPSDVGVYLHLEQVREIHS